MELVVLREGDEDVLTVGFFGTWGPIFGCRAIALDGNERFFLRPRIPIIFGLLPGVDELLDALLELSCVELLDSNSVFEFFIILGLPTLNVANFKSEFSGFPLASLANALPIIV
jgi:hypothetical protein